MAQSYNVFYSGTAGAPATVTAANLAAVRGDMVQSGVVRGVGSACAVTPTGTGLSALVATGDWFSSGYFGQSTGGTVTLNFAANASGSTRIDVVVTQIDTVANTASFVIVQGTPGSGAPAINTLGTQLQISLAQVSIAAGATGATVLLAANITDTRTYSHPLQHAADHAPGGTDPILFGASLAWPEGFYFGPTGTGLQVVDLGNQALTAGGAGYPVPTGYNLYVTRLQVVSGGTLQINHVNAGAFSSVWTSSSSIGANLLNPLIVQGGGSIKAVTQNGNFAGILIKSSGRITTFSISLASATTTSSAVAWTVINQILNSNGALIVAGQSIAPSSGMSHSFSTVGSGGAGALVVGTNSTDANGMAVMTPQTPILLSPSTVYGSNPGTATFHGYTIAQTG